MGGSISKDINSDRWVREPGLIPYRRFSDPGDGRPTIPVLKRRRSQPDRQWIDEAVEVVEAPQPATRSSSAPPSVRSALAKKSGGGGLLRGLSVRKKSSGGDVPKLKTKPSKKSLGDASKKAKEKPKLEKKPVVKKEKKKEEKKPSAPKPKKEKAAPAAPPPPPIAPVIIDGDSSLVEETEYTESEEETETESEPEPEPEPTYSFAYPRFAKMGSAAPAPSATKASNPWGAGAAKGVPAEPQFSFANPRISGPVRALPKKAAYTANTDDAPPPPKVDPNYKRPIPGVSAPPKKAEPPPKAKKASEDLFSGWGATPVVDERRPPRATARTSLDLLAFDDGNPFMSGGLPPLGPGGGGGGGPSNPRRKNRR